MRALTVIGFGAYISAFCELIHRQNTGGAGEKSVSVAASIQMVELQTESDQKPRVLLNSFDLSRIGATEKTILSRMWKEASAFIIAEDAALSTPVKETLQALCRTWAETAKPYPPLFVFGKAEIPNEISWSITKRWDGGASQVAKIRDEILVELFRTSKNQSSNQ